MEGSVQEAILLNKRLGFSKVATARGGKGCEVNNPFKKQNSLKKNNIFNFLLFTCCTRITLLLNNEMVASFSKTKTKNPYISGININR
ncbi:hypothetical protein B0I21_10472 [Sphingobacterium paludis]|uniref:Uncharacterized protein n=1 Tax=Sphingobacterium paludis TaxID=1476465 RepID=A0A4R7D4F5_9SPHI|nr:hypothetical protein B0I21_10472 [Sphingobacterium paludis]